MSTNNPTVELEVKTYDLLQQIKKIFVSYTGEDIDNFTDDKVVEILATGFFDSEDDGHEAGCCGGDCENDAKDGKGCGEHCHC